jgi:hypothetical protein
MMNRFQRHLLVVIIGQEWHTFMPRVTFELAMPEVQCHRIYERVYKSFRTGRLERELQMVQLSATRCSLYRYSVSQSSEFRRHNPLCCFSTSVYCCYFVIDSVRKLLDTPSYYWAEFFAEADNRSASQAIPAFYRTRRFIMVFVTARFTPLHPTSVISILILSPPSTPKLSKVVSYLQVFRPFLCISPLSHASSHKNACCAGHAVTSHTCFDGLIT